MYKLIDETYCYEGIDNLDTVKKSGYAFGQLHGNLADLDPSKIVDVIPDFHNTQKRYMKFLISISLIFSNSSSEKQGALNISS